MKPLTLAIGVLFFFYTSAQSNKADSVKIKTDSTEKKESSFKAVLSYLTNSTFNGRSDSAATPYFSPVIGYYSKYGFHIETSLSYLANSQSRIDNYAISAGYDVDIMDNLSASLSVDKNFNNINSTSIVSGVGGTISGDLSYDLDFISISAGAAISFSNKNDYSVNMGLNKEFSFGNKNNKWTITPSASASASTLHFYEEYTNRKIKKINKKGNPTADTITTITTISNRNVNKLTLLNIDLAAPIAYGIKKWGFSFSPTLSIPQNSIHTITTTVVSFKNKPSQTTKEISTPDTELNLRDLFFVEMGVSYKF